MAQRKSALKSLRSSQKKRLRNLRVKLDLKKEIKKFKAFFASKRYEEAGTALKKVVSKLDKAATKGVIHKNTASRKKSRLTKKLYRAAIAGAGADITSPPAPPGKAEGPSAPS